MKFLKSSNLSSSSSITVVKCSEQLEYECYHH